ncbi:hypothetical protein N9181_01180 [bacterium]|nr:hypothetical protein [bacterium]
MGLRHGALYGSAAGSAFQSGKDMWYRMSVCIVLDPPMRDAVRRVSGEMELTLRMLT